jgi:predicted nucleic acid-binding protein
MKGRAFFDTNVLIYAFAAGDPRAAVAEELLSGGGVVSVQSLNEFTAVALRKLGIPWQEILERLQEIRVLCPGPVPVTLATHEKALEIVQRHGYHIYDALIVAAAMESSCKTLYSEDMHDGQTIGGLTIRNPFRN